MKRNHRIVEDASMLMSDVEVKPRLHLSLLGTFHAGSPTGVPVSITMKKPRALLAYLALNLREPQARDRLAALLWPDTPAFQARLNLRQTLFIIRRAFEPSVGPILVDVDGHVGLDPDRVVVDALSFQASAAKPGRDALIAAADLYRGELLQGLDLSEEPFEQWLTVERERFRELAIEVLARLLRLHVDNEQPDAAIHVGLRLLGLDPCQEAVHRTLMRVYAGSGRRAAALRQYELCASALRRDFGLEPDDETEKLYRTMVGERGAVLQPA